MWLFQKANTSQLYQVHIVACLKNHQAILLTHAQTPLHCRNFSRLSENVSNYPKRPLKYFSFKVFDYFSNHISMWGYILFMLQSKQHSKTDWMQKQVSIQVSSIKPDSNVICKDVKWCHLQNLFFKSLFFISWFPYLYIRDMNCIDLEGHTFHRGSRLCHVVCLGEWDTSKYDISRGLKNAWKMQD